MMVVIQAMVCHSIRGMFACVSVCGGGGGWLVGWVAGWRSEEECEGEGR